MKKWFIGTAVCGILAASCHKKETNHPACLISCPLNATIFKFRVIDKQTGRDYFFSNPPSYPISALHVKTLQDTADVHFYTDSSNHLFGILCSVTGNTSFRVLVGNLQADTVEFVVATTPLPIGTEDARACCPPPLTIGQMVLDGQGVSNYSDTTALEIKK